MNGGLNKCTSMVKLKLWDDKSIDIVTLAHMRNLRVLVLPHNKHITDRGLSYIVNIVKLKLNNNKKITNKGLAKLKAIKILYMWDNFNIDDWGILALPNTIKRVRLSRESKITSTTVDIMYQRGCRISF